MNSFKNGYQSHLLLVRLLVMLVILNSNTCNCAKDRSPEDNMVGNIIMNMPTDPLIGDMKTASISFMLADIATIALVENFTLQVVMQEKGGTGSQISYNDNTGALQKTDKIDITLKSLSKADHLTAADPSWEIPFTFITSPTTSELTADFKLLNKAGEPVSNGQVIWKKDNATVNVSLSKTTPDKMTGDNKIIGLQIKNDNKVIEKGQLKLKIVRSKGTAASIIGASQKENTNVYIIDLPSIAAASSIPYDLTIEPKDGQQATFNIQLQYKGKDIGEVVTASWEKGLIIEVEHDRKTNDVKVFVTNTSTDAAKDVKLTYDTKTSNAKIGEVGKNEKLLKDLAPGEKREINDLGKLNFGKGSDGKDNMAAACEFGISCASSCPVNPVTTVLEKKVFTRVDIVLSLSVTYDVDKGKVNYLIENAGKDIASGLKLTYKNISADEEGKLATIAAKQEDTLVLGDLVNGGKFEDVLVVDLNGAEVASFNFELQYDNKPMAELVREFRNKPLNLSLEIINSLAHNGENYILYGASRELKFKVNQAFNSRTISLEDLKLSIEEVSNNLAAISKDVAGTAINELHGSDLKDTIKMYINPMSGAQRAVFQFHLKYKDEYIGTPVSVEWREYQLLISSPARLVGNQEGYFQIFSRVPINLDALTVALESEDEITFQLYGKDGNECGSSSILSKVANYGREARDFTTSIKFKIHPKQGQPQDKATLNIIVKHAGVDIAKKEIDWVKEGANLQLILKRVVYSDKPGIAIVGVKNMNDKEVKLDDIKIALYNTSNAEFTLGKISGKEIHSTVAEVTGENTLISQSRADIKLKINKPLGKEMAAGLIVVLKDKNGADLDKVHFVFNSEALEQVKLQVRSMLGDKTATIPSVIEKFKDNPGFLAYLLNRLEKRLRIAQTLLVKYTEIKNKDASNFGLIVDPIYTGIYDDSVHCEAFIQLVRAAIAQGAQNEASLMVWANEAVAKIKLVEEKIKEDAQKIETLDGLNKAQDINNFLSPDYDANKALDDQSIKGLYAYYNNKIGQIRAFLRDRGITDFEPAPENSQAIEQLKATYKAMVEGLPDIQAKVRTIFETGFEKFSIYIRAEQSNIKFEGNLTADQKKALYNILEVQSKLLGFWKNLLNTEQDLFIDTEALQNNLIKLYQDLAIKVSAYAEDFYNKNNLGNVTNAADLNVKIAKDADEIAQATKSEVTQQAVTRVYEEAIKTWKFFEKREYRKVFPKNPQIILEEGKELRSIPTVLQDLQTSLRTFKLNGGKGAKEEKQEKQESRFKNMFGSFVNKKNKK